MWVLRGHYIIKLANGIFGLQTEVFISSERKRVQSQFQDSIFGPGPSAPSGLPGPGPACHQDLAPAYDRPPSSKPDDSPPPPYESVVAMGAKAPSPVWVPACGRWRRPTRHAQLLGGRPPLTGRCATNAALTSAQFMANVIFKPRRERKGSFTKATFQTPFPPNVHHRIEIPQTGILTDLTAQTMGTASHHTELHASFVFTILSCVSLNIPPVTFNRVYSTFPCTFLTLLRTRRVDETRQSSQNLKTMAGTYLDFKMSFVYSIKPLISSCVYQKTSNGLF